MKQNKNTNYNLGYRIVQMGETEKQELVSWEEKFGDSPEFSGIKEFILEGDTYRSLSEMVFVNYEIFPIGDEERLLSFVAKNDSNEVVAWFLCQVFKTDPSKDPISALFDDEPSTGDFFTKKDNEIYSMFIKYIVTHPMLQGKGLGSQVLKELTLDAKKYIGVQPEEFSAYIHIDNLASQKIFSNLGFNFSIVNNDHRYFNATSTLPELTRKNGNVITSLPQQFGE